MVPMRLVPRAALQEDPAIMPSPPKTIAPSTTTARWPSGAGVQATFLGPFEADSGPAPARAAKPPPAMSGAPAPRTSPQR